MGVEAAGVVEAVGDGVTNVAPGDRVTYTGFVNTLGAYSTERLIPAAPLIKLPDAISCETAAAMTMRGLTSAYLMRRIWPLKRGRHDPAARGGRRRRPDRLAVGEAARPHRDRHGLDRGEGRGRARPRLRPRDPLRPRGRREARARAHRRRRRLGRVRQRRQGHLRGLARFAEAPRPARLRRHGLRARSRRSTPCSSRSRARCS